jgi:hypothetical protein
MCVQNKAVAENGTLYIVFSYLTPGGQRQYSNSQIARSACVRGTASGPYARLGTEVVNGPYRIASHFAARPSQRQ